MYLESICSYVKSCVRKVLTDRYQVVFKNLTLPCRASLTPGATSAARLRRGKDFCYAKTEGEVKRMNATRVLTSTKRDRDGEKLFANSS